MSEANSVFLGLNVEQFRTTLSRLGNALEKPVMPGRRWVRPGEQAQLIASLNELTSMLGEKDLVSQRALIGLVPKRADTQQTRGLVQSLAAIPRAVTRHFASQLDATARTQLRALLDFPAPNFLEALGVRRSENAHSDVLAYLLSPRTSPGSAPTALERLAHFLPDSSKWVTLLRDAIRQDQLSVRREVRTGGFWNKTTAKDRLDLIISSPQFVIVIENKLWSSEHANQTPEYWEWLSSLPGEKAAVFLSPAGFKAQSEHFVAMSYFEMAWCFLGECPSRLAEEEVMLAGYLKAVFADVLGQHLKAVMEEHE